MLATEQEASEHQTLFTVFQAGPVKKHSLHKVKNTKGSKGEPGKQEEMLSYILQKGRGDYFSGKALS